MAECPKCGETVYAADRVEALGGEWHKACLACTACGCKLNPAVPGLLQERDGAPFCKRCAANPAAAAPAQQPKPAPPPAQQPAAVPPVWAAAAQAGGIGKPVAPSPEIDDDAERNDAAAAASPVPPAPAPASPPAPKPASPPPSAPQPPPAAEAAVSPRSAKDLAAKFQALQGPAPPAPGSARDIAAKFRAMEAAAAAAAAAPKPRAAAPPPVSTPCPRCAKAVYAAEAARGPGGDWHRACLRCTVCDRALAAGGWLDHKGAPHCKPCFDKTHGPKGMRGGTGGGIMHAN